MGKIGIPQHSSLVSHHTPFPRLITTDLISFAVIALSPSEFIRERKNIVDVLHPQESSDLTAI
jgi:hypothetical protein